MSPVRVFRKINWPNMIFFSFMGVLTLTALPLYGFHVGFSRPEWILFWAFVITTGLSITVGYHRLFAHRAFQASPVITFLALFFGAAAFEQSTLMWASQHRDHHQFVDTERDPYNIKRGFWYAHMGWMLFWCQETDYDNVRDLSANPLIRHQHEHYLWWAIGAGVLLPLAIGVAIGHPLGALVLSVAGRLTLVSHSTFCINSVCHTFGRATYDIDATARDHWVVALLTNGEGYHNFHHRFASDYRNGIRWYHWDPSKWTIAMLSWVGLAKKLYRTPSQSILAARLAAQRTRVERELGGLNGQEAAPLLQKIQERYQTLKTALYEWERWEKEYRKVRDVVAESSKENLRIFRERAHAGHVAVMDAQRRWVLLINSSPLISRAARI